MAVIMRELCNTHTHAHMLTHTHTHAIWELCQGGKTYRARLPLASCQQSINKQRRRGGAGRRVRPWGREEGEAGRGEKNGSREEATGGGENICQWEMEDRINSPGDCTFLHNLRIRAEQTG